MNLEVVIARSKPILWQVARMAVAPSQGSRSQSVDHEQTVLHQEDTINYSSPLLCSCCMLTVGLPQLALVLLYYCHIY